MESAGSKITGAWDTPLPPPMFQELGQRLRTRSMYSKPQTGEGTSTSVIRSASLRIRVQKSIPKIKTEWLQTLPRIWGVIRTKWMIVARWSQLDNFWYFVLGKWIRLGLYNRRSKIMIPSTLIHSVRFPFCKLLCLCNCCVRYMTRLLPLFGEKVHTFKYVKHVHVR